MQDSRVPVLVTLAFLVYFLWMDVALFHVVNSKTSTKVPSAESTPSLTTPASTCSVAPYMLTPFTGLSVKLMMIDQVDNYVHIPAAQIFNEVTRFSTKFTYVTANMVSFGGLLMALAAAKFMSMESRTCHYIAIALFQLRCFMDALDGIVARCRIGMVQHVSIRHTEGYVVDGIADALGFTAFLIGCLQYFRTRIAREKNPYLPLNNHQETFCPSLTNKEDMNGVPTKKLAGGVSQFWCQRRIFILLIAFGFQLLLSCFFWDHYVNAYHNLLETQPRSQAHADAQNEVLKSSVTWVLMWFWRISNAHALMQMLLYSIYINKLGEFLTCMQYTGFVQILALAFFTEVHISEVSNYVIRA